MSDHTASPQARTRRVKKPTTIRDMFLSLAVVLVPLLLLTWLYTNNLPDYPVQAVDPAPAVARARAEAPYPILVPTGLPTGEGGWVVTQASWVPKGGRTRAGDAASFTNEWLWGALDLSKTYYAVNESDDEPRRVIQRQSREGDPDGASTVNGRQWERWRSPDGRTRVLVLRENGYTVTVTADASYEGLEALASTLSDH
ncbi:DUF4245 family protein [Raineyella fluvialis]|nr:DUF4245 family protein [Raineyella fluvialis]